MVESDDLDEPMMMIGKTNVMMKLLKKNREEILNVTRRTIHMSPTMMSIRRMMVEMAAKKRMKRKKRKKRKRMMKRKRMSERKRMRERKKKREKRKMRKRKKRKTSKKYAVD